MAQRLYPGTKGRVVKQLPLAASAAAAGASVSDALDGVLP